MAYIVYPKLVGNRDLLVNMLINQSVPLHKAAKKLKVSYGCLLHQAKVLLSEDEMKIVESNRARKRYTQEERMTILRHAKKHGVVKVAAKYGINPILIRSWRRKYAKKPKVEIAS
jgi:uncharacterized protein YjcR